MRHQGRRRPGAVGEGGYPLGMDVGDLPDGLPPGRLLAPDPEQPARWTDRPVCWVSDQRLVDAAQQWARLHAIWHRTGLWPVLLDGLPPPWSCDPRELDALDAEAILQDKWRYLVRLHQQRVGDRLWIANGPQGTSILDAAERPEGFQALPEGVRVLDRWTDYDDGEERMVLVEERARRFVSWPGLAPPPAAGRDPDVVAREVVASKLVSRMRPGFTPAFLGLVPVACSADLSAVLGWVAAASDVASDLEVAPVLRSWEQRFGAQVVALTDGIYLSVAAPPRTREHAEHLAMEHLLLCMDNLWNHGDDTFRAAWTGSWAPTCGCSGGTTEARRPSLPAGRLPPVQAHQCAGQQHQRQPPLGVAVPADRQAPLARQPRPCPLDPPALPPQPGRRLDPRRAIRDVIPRRRRWHGWRHGRRPCRHRPCRVGLAAAAPG